MAKITAKSQIDNVISIYIYIYWTCDTTFGKVSYKATTFPLKLPQSKLVCKIYELIKGERTLRCLLLANEGPFWESISSVFENWIKLWIFYM